MEPFGTRVYTRVLCPAGCKQAVRAAWFDFEMKQSCDVAVGRRVTAQSSRHFGFAVRPRCGRTTDPDSWRKGGGGTGLQAHWAQAVFAQGPKLLFAVQYGYHKSGQFPACRRTSNWQTFTGNCMIVCTFPPQASPRASPPRPSIPRHFGPQSTSSHPGSFGLHATHERPSRPVLVLGPPWTIRDDDDCWPHLPRPPRAVVLNRHCTIALGSSLGALIPTADRIRLALGEQQTRYGEVVVGPCFLMHSEHGC